MVTSDCNTCPYCGECNCMGIDLLESNINSMVECPKCDHGQCEGHIVGEDHTVTGVKMIVEFSIMKCPKCGTLWRARPTMVTHCKKCKKNYRANIMRQPRKIDARQI